MSSGKQKQGQNWTDWQQLMIQKSKASYIDAQAENLNDFRWSVNHDTGMAMFKCRPGSPEWGRWMGYYRSVGRKAMESVARSNLSTDGHGKYYPVASEWPPAAAREVA